MSEETAAGGALNNQDAEQPAQVTFTIPATDRFCSR